ncbi:hypothetical protein [Helicobacter pylori]|nr:hypothetical protein [Helicobacter pylori]
MISKTPPIPYEVYYQTKFKNKFLKIRERTKKPKIKKPKTKMGEI